jgi:hypothetical protein
LSVKTLVICLVLAQGELSNRAARNSVLRIWFSLTRVRAMIVMSKKRMFCTQKTFAFLPSGERSEISMSSVNQKGRQARLGLRSGGLL